MTTCSLTLKTLIKIHYLSIYLLHYYLLLLILFILYLNTKNQFEKQKVKNIYDKKRSLIRPKSRKLSSNEYPEMIDFIFSIQDMYKYNVPAYQEMIEHIDNFYELYEQSKITHSLSGLNYGIAEDKRREAVNALHSLIYNVPTNHIVMNKLENAVNKLFNLLGERLDEIYTLNKNYILLNGYSVDTVVVNRGPNPINFYSDEQHYTYDIY